ncbi:amidase [Salinisphaera sp. T31B1]|uniref:amidase n=1 Tax=Salinisphaera sp. T31B1 TaxID=727963 RepID=UPI00333F226A
MTDIHRLSATALAAAIADGQITSRVALDHFLARIEHMGEAVNAVIAMDVEAARARADAADAAIAAGERWGPLHGVPMTVKDTFEAAGLPTVVGEPRLKDYVSTHDAVTVARLKSAGAVIFGKTNTPRLAQDVQSFNSIYGTTNNPWNAERTSGGSSGGAAAALAAGFTALEIGSDLAGSIRTPASWCGVYGHKASYGLIPLRGHIPGPPGTRAEPDLCVAGPLARSADDLALALEVLAGPDTIESTLWQTHLPAPKPVTLADFRIAYCFEHAFCPLADATRTRLEEALESARRAGANVTRLNDLPGGFEAGYDIYDRLLNGMVGAAIPDKLYAKARRGAALLGLLGRTKPGTLGGFGQRATASHRDWADANEQRHRLRDEWQALFADYDVVLLPGVCVPAIPHDHGGNVLSRKIDIDGDSHGYTHLFRWIAPATVAGLPATSAPVGLSDDGLPVGLQIVAGYGQDLTTIAFARHLAAAGLDFTPPPAFG